MKNIKHFLTISDDPMRSAVIWNMVANLANAFQSMLILMIMSRIVGLVEAGIFSIGNTTANLFLTIGRFGCRSYQVSDVKKEYNFREYRMSRIISCFFMFVSFLVYVLYNSKTNSYTAVKTITILCMCFNKIPDAFEDVYFGEYQKSERLDISSKCYAIRLLLYMIIVITLIIITGNLLISMLISTVINVSVCLFFVFSTKDYISEHLNPEIKKVIKLMIKIMPLCVASFMTFYLNAAPRNSIDRYMSDTDQAIYGYVAMPVFVVQLLVSFFSNPLYHRISVMWEEKEYRKFIFETIKQMLYVLIISIVCILGAWLLGVPVLSIVFGTNLVPYKTELMILMMASGFLGMSSLLLGFLIIMRCQNQTLVSYIAVAVVAFLLSDKMVMKMGMRGACLIYLSILAILVAVFFVLYIVKLLRTMNEKKDKISED